MTTPKKPNTLLEIGVTILAPSVVLMQLSAADRLGPMPAVLLALVFPLAGGIRDYLGRRKLNWLAALGVVSTLLTGGIGLLKLDAQWLAVKEALVPSLIGLAIAGSAYTKTPLIRALVFNADLFDVDRIHAALTSKGSTTVFERHLCQGTLYLAGTFFFSAVANFVLTRWIVKSPAGTEAFNAELGRLTLLSYPIIALPCMVMMVAIMMWLARQAKTLTGLQLEEMLHAAKPA